MLSAYGSDYEVPWLGILGLVLLLIILGNRTLSVRDIIEA